MREGSVWSQAYLNNVCNEIGEDEHRDVVLGRNLVVDGCDLLLGRSKLQHPRMSFSSIEARAGHEWNATHGLVKLLAE
jgi:hypothetical protein